MIASGSKISDSNLRIALFLADLEGRAAIDVAAPDLANPSWIISGFSLDNLHGMGISEQLQSLEVFQPFFVKVELIIMIN